MMQPRIINELTQALSAFPDVERITLFGSRARGDNNPYSDIDIAVTGEGINWQEWGKIRRLADVEDNTIQTLLKIDLIHTATAGDALRNAIATEGQTLYERQ